MPSMNMPKNSKNEVIHNFHNNIVKLEALHEFIDPTRLNESDQSWLRSYREVLHLQLEIVDEMMKKKKKDS